LTDDSGDASGLDHAWAQLKRDGYVLMHERDVGLGNFRDEFLRKYFNDHAIMRHDPGDRPKDRRRARDVIRYQWRDGDLRLREFEKITITDRADIPGAREHKRVMLLDDPEGERLVRRFLELVPPELRQQDGTFGVNLFRTFTDVVSKPHQDREQFVMLYVLDRIGGGAESYLYNAGDVTDDGLASAGPVFKHQLSPGEILIFQDDRFKHGASPLEALPGGTARRDVLVCTVDSKETYLAASQPPGFPSLAHETNDTGDVEGANVVCDRLTRHSKKGCSRTMPVA
jgi:hypothetical protein